MYGLAVDAGHIYWAHNGWDADTFTIGRANLDGTNVNQNFISSPGYAAGLAVDAAHIYWGNAHTSTIGRANLDGTNVNPSFITGGSEPAGVAVGP